jgi:hypothetical protein
MYPTAEHLFQAHKFLPHRPDLAEYIRAMPTPRMALQEASRLRPYVRPDWFDVNVGIMDVVLENKFRQHAHLTELLRGTGKRELVEDSPVRVCVAILCSLLRYCADRSVLGHRRRHGKKRAGPSAHALAHEALSIDIESLPSERKHA